MVRVVWALVAVLLLSCPSVAAAAAVPWPNGSYAHYANREPLRSVLLAFGRSFGVKVEIGPGVSGEVDGRLFAETPSAFLDQLAKAYGLTWCYIGGTLHVNAASESRTRSIKMAAADVPAAREALRGLGVLDERFGWGEFPDRGVVMVSGPPAYVAAVERALQSLPSTRSAGMTISVFRLKHASVDDRSFTYRDRQVTIPGVATILRNIITNQSMAASGTRTEAIPSASVPTVLTGAASLAGVGEAAATPVRARPADAPWVDAAVESPVIQADTRINAVVVKDVAERMASYAQLVAMLDVQTALIEIEAAVIDVNTSRLEDLGVRWQGRGGKFSGGFGKVSDAQPTDQEMVLGWAGGGASLQTILSGTSSFFLSRVSALESTGDATVHSRPSVLTQDNLQAVLDLSETFYIRVTGERVAEVVPVSAGVLLKVTPRLIDEGGKRRIALDVDIEDGSILSDQQFSDIPTVRRSTISTQALVGERESLLIGGYYYETKVNNREKVPVLGDIPVVGLLFGRTEGESQKRERMFMITPRVIDLPPGVGAS